MTRAYLHGIFVATSVTLQFLFACPPVAAQQSGGAVAAFPEFKAHLVDRLPGGYKVAVVDIDRDGKPDVIGLATTPSTLAWYKNPNWERHTLTSQAKEYIDLAPRDIDGDGRIDLAIAHEFGMSRTSSGGVVSWLRCPEDPTQEWPMYAIGAEPTSHRIRWADIDGDGRKELIDAPIMGRDAKGPLWDVGARLIAYAVPDSPATEPWKSIVIDDQLTVIHGIAVVDWNGDGRDDILTASFEGVHLHRLSREGNRMGDQKTRLASGEQADPTKRGSSEIVVGRVGRKMGHFLAAIEPWHGDKVVVYTPGPDSHVPWQRTVIDATFNEGHALIWHV